MKWAQALLYRAFGHLTSENLKFVFSYFLIHHSGTENINGPWFFDILYKQISEKLSTFYLVQRISMAIQKGNADCVRGCPKKLSPDL